MSHFLCYHYSFFLLKTTFLWSSQLSNTFADMSNDFLLYVFIKFEFDAFGL